MLKSKGIFFWTTLLIVILIISTYNTSISNPLQQRTKTNIYITHTNRVNTKVLIPKLEDSKKFNSRSSTLENYNSSSLGFGWRTKEIIFNGKYYRETYLENMKTWNFTEEIGEIRAHGSITKIVSDPLRNDVVHVFFVNLTIQRFNNATVLEIQHFIVNITNQTIGGLYVLYMHNVTRPLVSFAGFVAFANSTNISVVYLLLRRKTRIKWSLDTYEHLMYHCFGEKKN